jgi:hypothetical protein
MFSAFFSKTKLDTKNKKSTASFLVKELLYNFRALRIKIKKISSNLHFKTVLNAEDVDLILKKKIRMKINCNINKRIFHIKEEFISLFDVNTNLFSKE